MCKCNIQHKIVIAERYKCNYSAFNGYHYTPSDYSEVGCCACGDTWRTKAKWVDAARTIPGQEFYDTVILKKSDVIIENEVKL